MKTIEVRYQGWGENWPLGSLADNGRDLLFEYSPEALRRGLELSPRHLPLRPEAFGCFPTYQERLPGLIADALPDGWGMRVMDRYFRKTGIDTARLSPLDRLAFVGNCAIGALSFLPCEGRGELLPEDLPLLELAHAVEDVVADRDTIFLRALALTGGSPQGARPKVLMNYDFSRNLMSNRPGPDLAPWLVKFPARGEHMEVCFLEDVYAHLARGCGLDIPATRAFTHKGLSAFGIARFDVEAGMRVPVHTLAGVLHANFQTGVDYTTFLRITRMLTHDVREVERAYERAVFNVVFNNRDDHAKNVSFRLGRDQRWRLAPCYDLTFCEGPGGEHHMDVCGEGRNIKRADMLELAKQGGLERDWAADVIDRFVEHAGNFRKAAAAGGEIRAATIKQVDSAIQANRKRLC
jgi:serine/threonine-protein kinase HipA